MAADYHLRGASRLYAGAGAVIAFTVRDEDDAPVNITGWSLSWRLRASPTSGSNLAAKTVGAGITITDAPGGVCQVALSAADMTTIGAQPFAWHELKRTDSGYERVLSHGAVEVEASIHA